MAGSNHFVTFPDLVQGESRPSPRDLKCEDSAVQSFHGMESRRGRRTATLTPKEPTLSSKKRRGYPPLT